MSTKKNYAYLNYLKAFASIFVVTHHAITHCGLDATSTFARALCYFIGYVTIPLFFCVAGYLCHPQKVGPYYTKKVSRLFIPFVFFSILKLAYSAFISSEHAHSTSLLSQLYDAFVCGSLYWFIYAILIVYLISPLFWKSNRLNIILLISLFAGNIVLNLADITLPNVLQLQKTFEHVGYFLLGVILHQNKQQIAQIPKKFIAILFAASLLAGVGILWYRLNHNAELVYWLKAAAAFSFMYLLYVLAKVIPQNLTLLEMIGKRSLQIMFFDSFFKVILFKVLPPGNSLILTVVIVVNIAATCIGCYILEKIPYVRRLFGL